MTQREYDVFDEAYQRYKTSTFADKEKKLEALYDKYERGLTYIGSTAIEDKL